MSEYANAAAAILTGGRDDRAAVFHGQRATTYGQLRDEVCGWQAFLAKRGLVRGDRVGLFAENSPLFIAAYLGTLRGGFCSVPFPVDCSEKTFERIAVSTSMKHVVVSARFLSRVRPWAERLGLSVAPESSEPPTADPATVAPAKIDSAREPAAVMFTSGSTGDVKGVVVTHQNILVNTEDILSYIGLGPDDRVMVVLPFYYCFGTSLLHTHLMAGGSLVINNRFLFPEKVLDEMEQRQCTGLAGVPATYQILLRKTSFPRRALPSLRWLQQAGGKLPNPLIREIREAFPTVKFFLMYGQTEATARLSYLPPEWLDDKLGSIGRGLPHTRLDVLRADGTPVVPGSDEVGEIVASGENITLGYWNDPAETARYFRDGRLHTGDMARVDADGFIFMVERSRDFIKAAGHRISPKEVEDVLSEVPEIVEAAVIGVPDELLGEAVRAFIVTTRPGCLTPDAVQQHCLTRLPNYKIPQQIEFVPALPKTGNGKMDKEALRRAAASAMTKASQ